MGNSNSAPGSKQSNKERKDIGATGGSFSKNKRAAPGQRSHNLSEIRSTNPFLVFFLRLRHKKPNTPVTTIAKAAGKRWSKMTLEQRAKYIAIAAKEKKRRKNLKLIAKRRMTKYSRN